MVILFFLTLKLDIAHKGKTELQRNRPKWVQKDAGKFAVNISMQKITEIVEKVQY